VFHLSTLPLFHLDNPSLDFLDNYRHYQSVFSWNNNEQNVIFLLVLLILGSGLCAQNSVPEPLVSANQPGLLDSLKTALPDSLSKVPAQLDSLFYAADRIKFHYKDEQIFLLWQYIGGLCQFHDQCRFAVYRSEAGASPFLRAYPDAG
jgi:hypothetical protein